MVPDRGAAFLGGINRALGRPQRVRRAGAAISRFPEPRHRPGPQRYELLGHGHDPRLRRHGPGPLNTPSPDGVARTYPGMSAVCRKLPAAIAARTFPRNAANLAGNWRVEPDPPAPVSDVAAEQANRAARQATRAEEADSFFARGQQAEADGKPNVAKIYYQMAARRATGDLKQQVQARLDVVSGRNTCLGEEHAVISHVHDGSFPLTPPRHRQ